MRSKVIEVAQKYVGAVKGDDLHKELVDNYNTIKPLPRGYKVSYSDSYCATAVSAWFNMAGLLDLITPECGVQEMINGAIKKGIWEEYDDCVPREGDLICFHWGGEDEKDNIGWGNHIALVESVSGSLINTINPNTNGGKCERTAFIVGAKDIRGFIRPRYDDSDVRRIVPKKRYFYCEHDCITPCNIQQGSVIRNYMLDSDRFEIVGEDEKCYQIKVVDWATWYPYVKKEDLESD